MITRRATATTTLLNTTLILAASELVGCGGIMCCQTSLASFYKEPLAGIALILMVLRQTMLIEYTN